ncbi:MAG: GNAT family protein, partial [Vicinamibacterales bacterium]
ETAEWGFALGSAFWSKGVYADAAEMVIEFAFGAVGARRLEARTAVANGRGAGALRKMGATREAILEGTLEKDGQRLDQQLWTIRDLDWHRSHQASPVVMMH